MPPKDKNKPAGSKPVENTPDVAQQSPPVESTPTPDSDTLQVPEQKTVENHDDTDVDAALQRSTQDGKGDGDVPESDFDSFATEGVEKGEEKTVEVIANEVLQGKWGDGRVVRQRLKDAGHDPSAVQTEVNSRLASGAPSAYSVDIREVAAQVIRGEWGADARVEKNLERAGYNVKDVAREVDKQLGN